MKNLIEQFPDATKKPERKIEKYYPPDDEYFTKMFNRDMLLIGLFGMGSAIALVVLFYVIIYAQAIDEYLTPIK